MPTNTIVVPRPPQPRLRKLAAAAGVGPKTYLQRLLLTHGNQALAAEAAGVTPKTIRLWMDRMGTDIEREDAA